MAKKVKEVIELIEQAGWRYERTKGDHRIFKKDGAMRPVVVPGKLSDTMKECTYQSILRSAGLK